MDSNTQSEPAGSGNRKSFFLSADMFPSGMANALKPGSPIQLKVISGLDDQGQIEVEIDGQGQAAGQAMAEGEEEGGSWEDEARGMLSPQADENEAM